MPETGKKLIIAIDGHSSSGKSSFAKAVAAEMNYLYIDSGAMYRAVTLACMERGLIRGGEVDGEELADLLDNIEISFRKRPGSPLAETYLNGVNVEERIRAVDVSSNVSPVSRYREVRKKLVALQREMGKERGIVMDGRDIGTVVFPEADIKIFMTAEPAIRAQRRYLELREKGMEVNYDEILANVNERDRIDQSREESPLKRASDALLLDNSHMTPGQQMIWFRNLLDELKILNQSGYADNH